MKPAISFSKIAIAILLTLSSASSFGVVTLNVGDNTIVTAINGQEVKNGMFSNPQRKFELQPGKHVITAKYTRLYNLRNDEHDVLRSSNISLPVELMDNQTYELVMANQPDSYAKAKDYAKKPTLAIVQGTNTLASQQASTVSEGSGIFSGLGSAIGGIFGGGSKAVASNQQAINALDGKSPTTIPAIAPTVTPTTPAVASTNMLDQFMNLWLKATPAEREKIRQWVQN